LVHSDGIHLSNLFAAYQNDATFIVAAQLDLATVEYLLEVCDFIISRDKWEKPFTRVVAVPLTGLVRTAGINC